jgi:cadmium resistance protein CadD (predicted permease)
MTEGLFARNEHKIERILRVVVGMGALSLVFYGPQTMLGLLGLVPLVTGLMGTCPVYSILGFSTCPRDGNC